MRAIVVALACALVALWSSPARAHVESRVLESRVLTARVLESHVLTARLTMPSVAHREDSRLGLRREVAYYTYPSALVSPRLASGSRCTGLRLTSDPGFLTIDEYAFHDAMSTLWGWPNQNPLRWSDPSGHTPALAAAFFGFGGGGAAAAGGAGAGAGLVAVSAVALPVLAVAAGTSFIVAAAWDTQNQLDQFQHPTITHGNSTTGILPAANDNDDADDDENSGVRPIPVITDVTDQKKLRCAKRAKDAYDKAIAAGDDPCKAAEAMQLIFKLCMGGKM